MTPKSHTSPHFVVKAETVFVDRQPNYLTFILVFPVSRVTHMLVMSFSVGQTRTLCLWQEGEAQKLPETPMPFNDSTPSRELGTLRYLPKQRTVCARKHFALTVFNLGFHSYCVCCSVFMLEVS